MKKSPAIIVALFAMAAALPAAQPPDEKNTPPKSPADSLAAIHVPSGFTIELVASEPLTMDPVAFEWGADGKLWIVEMGDYPSGVDGKNKPGGIVRYLQDTHGDGHYDKSTVFLENVPFPNGIIPWRNGVIVSSAPDIFYAEDTDGDGKADVQRVLFTGFKKGNQQHRLNGFDYGLDNWLYGANGDSGGVIPVGGKTIDISGRDFRFRPDEGVFETQVGMSQYGRHRDDWGNWFGGNNNVWAWHYFLPEQYLRRNPHLVVKETRRAMATYPDQNRIFPISPTMPRFNYPDQVNALTSGCSVTPYRDDLFGSDFARSIFICKPANNLVHREVLEPDGVTFTSHRAPGDEKSEFLASTDNWSRFVYAKTGPDGALYIADMYRFVIEHPKWIPPEEQKRLSMRAGHDKGRIYRIYPTGAKLRPIPRLDKLDTAGLVAALDSPNGWQRDTAQRLLVHKQDEAAAKPLQKLVESNPRAKTRLQALCTLDGLHAANCPVVFAALHDTDPAVREHAVRLSERFLANARTGASLLIKRLLSLVDDPEIRVRYQLVFSLGEWNDAQAGRALAQIAMRDAKDANVQTAVMSSATKHVDEMLKIVLAKGAEAPPSLMRQLIGLGVASKNSDALSNILHEITKPQVPAKPFAHAAWQFDAAAELLDGLAHGDAAPTNPKQSESGAMHSAREKIVEMFPEAWSAAFSTQTGEERRLGAIRLLGCGGVFGFTSPPGKHRAEELMGLQESPAIQATALAAISRSDKPQIADILIAGWDGFGPAMRLQALNIFFRRPDWLDSLLKAVEEKKIPAGQVTIAQQQKLLGHKDPAIRERATKLFTATNADRAKVVKDYTVVSDLTGDPAKGAVAFRLNCTPCHRLRGEGNELGPDVTMLSEKPVPYFLEAILDPSKAVEARYLSYTAVTKSDREITGIITSETPNGITIKSAGGIEEAIPRFDLRSLTGSTASLMPEGFEGILKPQDIADLIAYIKSSPRAAPAPK